MLSSITSLHLALLYCVNVFMGTCKMLITLFLCLDVWVVGWVVFHHFQLGFVSPFSCFSVLM